MWLGCGGSLLLVAGLAMRGVVAGQVGIRRAGVRKCVAASRLQHTGLYAHTRNPLYLGNLFVVFGLTLIYDSRRAYVTALPAVILAVAAMVGTEEAFLAAKFPDEYRRYCAHVNRLVPRLGGLWKTLRTTPFDGRRALRREYGTLFATASSVIALTTVKYAVTEGLAASLATIGHAALAWAACLVVYLVLRWLKKSKRLKSLPRAPHGLVQRPLLWRSG